MPFALFRSAVISCCLLVQKTPATAQARADLHRYDAQIEFFEENGQPDSIRFYANKKTQIARQADSLAQWGWAQFDITESLSDNPREALKHLDAALAGRWREPTSREEWEPFLYLQASRGWLLLQTGKMLQAAQVFENVALLYERFRYAEIDGIEQVYKPLGTIYTRLGDNEKALVVFQKALLLDGSNESLSGIYANIGIAHWNQGNYAAAAANYQKGRSLPGISAAKRGLLLGRLAETLLDEGQTAEAYRRASEALRHLQRISPDDLSARGYRALARHVAGLACIAMQRWEEAGQLLEGATADIRAVKGEHSRESAKTLAAQAKLLRLQGRHLPAMEAANRALNAVLPDFQPRKPSENPAAASLYEEIAIAEALEAKAAAAESLFEKNGDLSLLQLWLECLDLAWQVEARLREAYQYSSSKLYLQKSARAREEAAVHTARQLFEKTGQARWLEKAFAIAERSKAALLLEAARENLVRQRFASQDDRFGQIATLRQSRSFFEKNLLLHPDDDNAPQWRLEADSLTGRIVALERAVAQDYPSLAELGTAGANVSPPGPGDLTEGEALAEYFVGERFVDVFVFQKNRPAAWHRIPNDADLQALAARFLACFKDAKVILNNPANYLQAAFGLWQKTIPPEAAQAPKLLVVPDGFFNFVPFEALVTEAWSGASSLRNAAYLIRRQQVRYAWSLAVLRQQNDLKSNAGRYLLALAPGFANGERGLAPLRAGSDEWGSAGRWGLREMTGGEADVQHFLSAAEQYRVLHLYTHAFAADRPRIELYDGALHLPDIYALSLQADLVVLSACETGLGQEQKGEGVMSLARAFAQSGAACIVSSLWSVSDRSTAQVMRRFYNNIGAGETVCASLRAAKLAYINDPELGAGVQSPYFWAGLAAVGSDRKLGKDVFGSAVFFWLLGGLSVMFIFILYRYFGRNRHFPIKNGR